MIVCKKQHKISNNPIYNPVKILHVHWTHAGHTSAKLAIDSLTGMTLYRGILCNCCGKNRVRANFFKKLYSRDQTMQAIEFESILHNGRLEIPMHYQNWEGRHVKVILLTDEPPTEQKADAVFKLLTELSDDFMEQGRQQLPMQMREAF